MVLKGQQPGPCVLITSGVHGDEMNGARVIHELFQELTSTDFSGTLLGLPQVSPNSLLHINKNWFLSNDGGDYCNLNRVFPGTLTGNSAQQHAALVFNNLIVPNVDYAIDLHSQSTDTEYPLFVFADFTQADAKTMALLIPADHIKNDAGEIGTLETSLIQASIPAITLEIGAARVFQAALIQRAKTGIYNILSHYALLQRPLSETAHSVGTFIGNEMASIRAQSGGYTKLLVTIGANVARDELLAYQYNPFGDLIQEYRAPCSGKIVSIGTGATREAGGLIARILY
jgi:hypothetical protein